MKQYGDERGKVRGSRSEKVSRQICWDKSAGGGSSEIKVAQKGLKDILFRNF